MMIPPPYSTKREVIKFKFKVNVDNKIFRENEKIQVQSQSQITTTVRNNVTTTIAAPITSQNTTRKSKQLIGKINTMSIFFLGSAMNPNGFVPRDFLFAEVGVS